MGGGPAPANVSPVLRRKAFEMVTFNWTWMLPTVSFAAPLLKHLFPAEGAPAIASSSYQVPFVMGLWFVLHDISFYCYHRVLHEVPGLYARFHKPHHLFTAPFAWSSHALHPVEMALQSIGALSGPLLWSFTQGLSLRALWSWLALIQFQGVMDHTGYELPFPFDVFKYIPGCGGTAFHDDHHKLFTCNYAAVFSAIDHLMGTSRSCKEAAQEKKRS